VVVREGAIPVEELREVVPSILTRAEADEQAARKVEEAEATSSASSEAAPSERALDDQADLDEAYEQWDNTHTVSGEPARRASAPAAGSVAASLLSATSALSSAFSTGVDQERARGYRDNTPKPVRADEPQTLPVPADTARALVFGESKIETAAKSAPAQSEAKAAEAKAEDAEPEAKTEVEVKTEQKDAPEDHL
jgi:translation factor SUA5